jgi:GAF domain-containing protein
MSDPYTNTYQNVTASPSSDEGQEFIDFFKAADAVLKDAAELARVVTNAHQGAAAVLIEQNWQRIRKYFSLSEKYAVWANYKTPATGYGIHGYILKLNRPIRLTQVELETHPEWRSFGNENGKHPPMRGWLAVPLIGSDGLNYGLMQASDRTEGEFNETDEANLLRLATLTSTALDSLALLHLTEYRKKMGFRY